MRPTIETIDKIYSPDLLRHFPDLLGQLDEYYSFIDNQHSLRSTTTINLETTAKTVQKCAKQLQAIAQVISDDIRSGHLNPEMLYRLSTGPARIAAKLGKEENQIGIIPGEHHYFVLDRERTVHKNGHAYQANNILALLQRVPFGMDTGPEVHGITADFQPAPYGGIEVYLPLVDGITFVVNGEKFHPRALEQLITILPGDVHHHIKNEEKGPARVLIIAGFHFTYGVKTADTQFIVPEFANIKRMTPVL